MITGYRPSDRGLLGPSDRGSTGPSDRGLLGPSDRGSIGRREKKRMRDGNRKRALLAYLRQRESALRKWRVAVNPFRNSRAVPGIPGYAEERGGEARGSSAQGIAASGCLLVRGACARVSVPCAARPSRRRAPVCHAERKPNF
jgi:hypothetical protein